MNYYQELTHESIQKLIDTTYNKSFDINLHIYKGITHVDELSDYYLATPSKNIRPSKTVGENGNSYNLLLNNLTNWNSLPKREKSIIGSSNIKTARSFTRNSGKVYRIVPIYNSEIAIASKDDIWYSFRKCLANFSLRGLNVSLVQFNRCLDEIFKSTGLSENIHYEWIFFLKCIEEISTEIIVPNKKLSFEAEIILKTFKQNRENVIGFIEKSFDPVFNDIQLKNYNGILINSDYPDNEIWTESDTLLIEESRIDQLLL